MVHVSHLRDKIEDATNGEQVIQTVWGVGYKIDEVKDLKELDQYQEYLGQFDNE